MSVLTTIFEMVRTRDVPLTDKRLGIIKRALKTTICAVTDEEGTVCINDAVYTVSVPRYYTTGSFWNEQSHKQKVCFGLCRHHALSTGYFSTDDLIRLDSEKHVLKENA